MRDYLIAQRKEQKSLRKDKKSKGKGKHKDETPEERRARKARKKEKKAKKIKSAGMKGVEDLLNSLGRPPPPENSRLDDQGARHGRFSDRRSRTRSPRRRSRSRSPPRPHKDDRYRRSDSGYRDEDSRHPSGNYARERS